MVQSDVKHAWDQASTRGDVDLLLFTLGGLPGFSLTKGVYQSPANLVTESLLNALCTMPTQVSPPKLVVVSSTGITHSSHAALPLPLKAFYGQILAAPHKDKFGVERVVAHCAGWKWDDGEPSDEIIGKGWLRREGLPTKGTLKESLLIKAALLTDRECKAEKGGKKPGYRVKEQQLDGAWTVSRKDVAHFIATAVLSRWNEFSDKCVSIAY
ncbi:hypothetical protein BDP27DRAFT_472482 [Rhodocollybia butyracea]|uniref:NAD(P)-binding domain-containing protein n=1 Tax=Rhodocollybia butyracea TaxID=206335 RepID=A0A9P5QA61_9AGAR|nr:hypothetical protein BDP27DRAFT_472482 [Rhodocollybia butyracea]